MLPPLRLIVPVPATAVTVPVQVLATPLGVATTTFVGSVSVKATPVSATEFAEGLVRVSVRVETLPGAIDAGLNALAIEGGATTAIEAVAAEPVPAFVVVTELVVLFFVPADVPVTFTEKEQLVLAASVAPDTLTLPEPAVAIIVPAPQLPVRPFGVATTSPLGRVSVNAMPVTAEVEFGFARLKVSDVVPFSGMLAAPNTLLIVGGPITVRVAVLLVAPVPLSFEEIVPVVLFFTPTVVPCTLSEIVQ